MSDMRHPAAVRQISPRRGLLLLATLLLLGLHLLGCAHGPDYSSSDAITGAPAAGATCRPSEKEHHEPGLAGVGGPAEGHHALCEVGVNRIADPRLCLTHAAPAALLPAGAEGSALEAPARHDGRAAACAPPAWRQDTLTLLCVSRT